jgi:hypothetical protein
MRRGFKGLAQGVFGNKQIGLVERSLMRSDSSSARLSPFLEFGQFGQLVGQAAHQGFDLLAVAFGKGAFARWAVDDPATLGDAVGQVDFDGVPGVLVR